VALRVPGKCLSRVFLLNFLHSANLKFTPVLPIRDLFKNLPESFPVNIGKRLQSSEYLAAGIRWFHAFKAKQVVNDRIIKIQYPELKVAPWPT